MTRNGKIARLPRDLREQVNERIRDNESGKSIVKWLNTLTEVWEVMGIYFRESPVTEQSLSEWKQGGYQDWLRHQEDVELARTLGEQGDELAEEAGLLPLPDRVAPLLSLALARTIRELLTKPLDTPEKRMELIRLTDTMTNLQRRGHEAARLKLELERIRDRKKDADENKVQDVYWRKRDRQFAGLFKALSHETALRSIVGGMSLEEENKLRDHLKMPRREVDEDSSESHSPEIKPRNPTESESIGA